MEKPDDKGRALRVALEKALDKDKPKEVVASLQALERLEPSEPRWPQKRGDYALRRGGKQEAETSYLRAFELLVRQGFLPRAVALAKLIVEINPARAKILESINQESARTLRQKPGVAAESTPPPAVASQSLGEHLILAPGAPIPAAVASARPLSRAPDASVSEVRFEDLTDDIVEVDASDMAVISLTPPKDAPAPVSPDPNAALIAKLSGTALFADVAPRTLAALVIAAKRLEFADDELVVSKGTPADAIFVIAEGVARVIQPSARGGGVDLAAGQIFGEACLVRRSRRQADVRAKGKLVLLRINVDDLHRIIAQQRDLNELLFELMAGRLVANLLQTSTLFAAFDAGQREELARMFEVRVAPAGTVLQEKGKRSDGLYVTLMGEIDMEEGALVATLAAGSIFGHASLLSRTPADRTIRASTDAVVLRMPATRFAAFAAQFPPALAYLADLASRPVSMWHNA